MGVNTYTPGNQTNPSVASLSSGNFVVAWEDDSSHDGSGLGIFGQIFTKKGTKVLSEFQVNTYTPGNQILPSVSTLSNGNYIITWTDESGEDKNGYGVFGQIFNQTGAKIGTELQVNTYTPGNQWRSSVSPSNGNFIVAWEDENGHDGNDAGVFGQIFNQTGAKIGTEFQVNTYTLGNQYNQFISSLSDGNFVITWQDDSGYDGNSLGVFGQIFNPTAAKIGTEFQINTHTTGNQSHPTGSVLSNDHFVAIWQDDSGYDGNGDGVFGQIFNATGSKVGSEFQVNTYTTGNQGFMSTNGIGFSLKAVSTLKNGNFVVAWEDESGHDGNGTGIFAQIFNTSFPLLPTTGTPALPGTTGIFSTGSILTTGTTAFHSTSGAKTGVSATAHSSNSSNMTWLWGLIGALGGVICVGGGLGGYFLTKKRHDRDNSKSDEEMSNEQTYGTIGSKNEDSENYGTIAGRPESDEAAYGTIVESNKDENYGSIAGKPESDEAVYGTIVSKNDEPDNYGTIG